MAHASEAPFQITVISGI